MLALWINRALEALWLLTVVLVPLAFLGRIEGDPFYAVSEAVIAYVEVPKVALLRILVGLMAILWLLEWGVQGRHPPGSQIKGESFSLRPAAWLPRLAGWLRDRPSRWLILAVWFFLGTTLLSTLLSGSFEVSLWGEVPGQDGYPAYTIVAYVVLFGVIATHLRTRAQLWRILGAIVVMGTLVSGLAVLQHYGHDFLNLAEPTGGRTTSAMGNRIFAAAVMVMTIPISLVAATITLPGPDNFAGSFRRKLRLYGPVLLVSALWTLVLTVQLLGITFTFSRGPWLGTLAGLVALLGLVAVFVGWSTLGRATLLLGIPAALTLAVVQWQVPVSSPGLWLGATLALGGLLALVVALGWQNTGRVALVLGVAAVLAAAVLLMPSWFQGGARAVGDGTDAAPTAVEQRFRSISGQVVSGELGGRGTHWKVSRQIILERPWFAFDYLSLHWLRPMIGYGPDLFRYTYLLRSPPEDYNRIPLEPDHAHNYFIHQTVEQGYLGLLSSLGVFAAVFLVSAYQLLRQRRRWSLVDRLLLGALLATLAGRFLEMMVGVARVSDLTILWVLLVIFAALPRVQQAQDSDASPQAAALPRGARQRNRRPVGVSSGTRSYDWQLFWRLAVVAWLVGGIGMLTWIKGVNYPRAALAVGQGVEEFRRGDFQGTLAHLERAIKLAPDVSSYYNYRGQLYLAYQLIPGAPREQQCGLQTELPYQGCLAVRWFQSNLDGASQRPFYYRSRLALANSAFNLKLNDEAARFYQEVVDLVPGSPVLRIESAEAYLQAGRAQGALRVLGESLAFAPGAARPPQALFIQGRAHKELGQLEESAELLERSLDRGLPKIEAMQAHKILGQVYTTLGHTLLAKEHYKQSEPK